MSGFIWSAPDGESNSAFLDYLQIIAGKEGWEDLLDKYHVDYVLWSPEESEVPQGSRFLKKWLMGWGGETYDPEIPLTVRLKTLGWNETYKDDITLLLERP